VSSGIGVDVLVGMAKKSVKSLARASTDGNLGITRRGRLRLVPEVEVDADFETGFDTNGVFLLEDLTWALLFVLFDKPVEGGRTPELRSELIIFSKALTAGSLTMVVVQGMFSSSPLTI
jgi:hypothetical protein